MTQASSESKSRVISFRTRGNNKLIEYVLTNEDWLTLARAVQWEGPPQDAVAWTLIQRFAYLYPLYPTLERFIKAYAQPINPHWFPDGAEHKKWLDTLQKAGKKQDADREIAEAVRRLQKASTPLDKISPKYIAILNDMFTAGRVSPVPGSVHYRAPTVQTTDVKVAETARAAFAAKKQMIDNVHVGNPVKDNWFFSETASRNISVSLLLKAATAAKGLVIMLAAGGLLYWLYTLQEKYHA